MKTINIDVGDVVLVSIPFSDAIGSKKRPALVIGPRDSYGDVLVLAVTSQPDTPGAIALTSADLAHGAMVVPSWVKPEKINPVHVGRIERVLGRAKPHVLSAARAHLCPVLGCK